VLQQVQFDIERVAVDDPQRFDRESVKNFALPLDIQDATSYIWIIDRAMTPARIGRLKMPSPSHGQPYDPTYSTSFDLIARLDPDALQTADPAFWASVLEKAVPLMDDDLRETVHAELAPSDNPLEFLLRYMAQHEKLFNGHFEWR